MIQPLGTFILIEPDKEETKTKQGLYIPTKSNERTSSGVVIGIGKEVKNIRIGDRIIYTKYGEEPIEYEDKKYILRNIDEIFAKEN